MLMTFSGLFTRMLPIGRACAAIAMLSLSADTMAQVDFNQYFEDETLRLDYVFGGDAAKQYIFLDQMYRQDKWAGRRGRLDETFLEGNGQLTVRDHDTHKIIYVWTFSTLFQEWLRENEAKEGNRSFETCYNIPFPKQKVDVTVTLTDNYRRVVTEATHTIDPQDVLIRQNGQRHLPYKYVWKGAGMNSRPDDEVNLADCVDIAIIADGYTADEMEKFYKDSQRAADALFEREPFSSMKQRFNVVAVAAPSADSGPSVPRKGIWHDTAIGCHYDTFHIDRYLTTEKMQNIYNQLSGVPFEHIVVLVNSDLYGGGGIYNQVTFTTSDHATFKQVLVHEFGHAYGGLADEYAYDDMDSEWYPADVEPWEPNVTTLHDFDSKWKDMMPKGQPIPTPLDPSVPHYKTVDRNDAKAMARLNACVGVVGVFEGAGYQTKGCYRPAQECRMKINEVLDFCPVCTLAIRRITEFYVSSSEK